MAIACQPDEGVNPIQQFSGTLNSEVWEGDVRTYSGQNNSPLININFEVAIDRGETVSEGLYLENLEHMISRIPLRYYPDSLYGHTFPTADMLTTLRDGDVSGPSFRLLSADSLTNYVEIVTIDAAGLSGNLGVTLVLDEPSAFPEQSALDTVRIEVAEFEVAF